MSTNGILDFQNTNKIIFGGSDSNVVIDTSNVSLGIGIQGTETPGSNLHVVGDAYISSNLKLTTDTSILVNSNVVTNFSGPHARLPKEVPLKKYPEIAFDASKADVFGNSNAYAQAGYEISSTSRYETGVAIDANDIKFAFDGRGDENGSAATPSTLYPHYASQSSSYSTSNPFAYTLFTNNVTDKDGVNYSGEEIKLKLPNKIKLSKLNIVSFSNSGDRQARNGHIFGSNTGANGSWTKIIDFTNLNSIGGSSLGTKSVSVSTVEYFEWYSLVITHLADSGGLLNLRELEYYGYEEDPPLGDTSVDTTFTSIMNTPQTTGANVYVDAKLSADFTNQVTGPTPVGTAAVHDNTNKYWEMNGQLTSNITVEANTFLEGDQPHAVSVWFNSSNLEANVSNTCVFSVSDQEKLDSVNLDLQSNTWHNLTYAYQGEGGSRVTYLDGRKVAEDQAEDTFGAYPPFEMTGYSQGGYVASVSNYQSGYEAWEIFDQYEGASGGQGWWQIDTERYSTSGNYDYISGSTHNLGTSTGSSTSTDNGHWVKIEMPHKLKLSYVNMKSAQYHEQGPKDFKFYGSKNNKDWELIKSFTNATPLAGRDYTINSTVGYKAIGLVVTAINGHGGGQLGLSDMQLYGHRENDLVRLPDPTNVLKYPHVAMTGPAQRGYVASASTQDSTGFAYLAFDGIADGSRGYHGTGVYSSGVYQENDKLTGPGPTDYDGEWIKLELPHKIKVTGVSFAPRTTFPDRIPHKGYILGSNTGSDGSWELVHSFDNVTTTEGVTKRIDFTGTNVYYKHIAMVAEETNPTSGTRLNFSEMEYYGTGVDSVPIQIGGGNIDKVANFRVYDKFIDQNQALEIWDAQKDEFGRAKSSMTLHKGRLGIGTTEPEGRLAVADEPDATTYGLQEFPPKPLVGYKTYMEGHGEFCVSATSIHTTSGGWHPYYAFDKKDSSMSYMTWESGFNDYASAAPHNYGGNFSLGGYFGEYIDFKMPYSIKLNNYSVSMNGSWSYYGPKDFMILASNDSKTWDQIHLVSGQIWASSSKPETINYNVNDTKYYNHFALLVTALAGNARRVNIAEIKFFGYREQVTKQSVLHDGQLTLTKSLNVPRIGPALDADDTPRRDRLVVEYNTSTSQATGIDPYFRGVVRDTSGRGNDGVYYRRAAAGTGITGGYDATEKALQFTTQNTPEQHIKTSIGNRAGAYVNSGSFWINAGTMSANMIILQMGKGVDAATKRFQVALETTGVISFGINSSNTKFQSAITTGSWFHVAYSYDGGVNGSSSTSYKLYINGVSKAIASGVGSATLNLDADAILAIGSDHNATANFFNGSISQFKLYDTALTAEEAKTLYDMGRCDEGHHMVNFSKTRVGIGLGDGEAPQSALDVRGVVSIDNIIPRGYLQLNQGSRPGASTATHGMRWTNTDNSNHWHLFNSDNDHFRFVYNGVAKGFVDPNDANAQMNFTGQHRTFIKNVPFSQVGELEGLIVSSDQNKYIKMSGGIEVGSNAITTNESLPVVSLSNVVTDKRCFGVISASEDPEERSDSFGNFVTPYEKEKGDTRVYINSVGEGAIWVSNIGGSLESGDYITTSNVAGYGQKQESDSLKNYTVAKITMDCDFEPATQPIQQILRSNVVETYYLGNVHKVKNVPHEFVTTTVTADDAWSNVSINPSDTTYAEWSNLEANTQNTYTLTYTQTSNVVYDTKYTLTTTANVAESDSWDRVSIDPPGVTYAEYSNLEANTQSSYSLTFTKTTTDEKTPDEWSALESNTQSLYNKVYYQSVEEEVAKDYPGAVAHTRVTDVIENELDEHGQIQWEDHATETEKAYKIRYLDASGAQTDEANAVHIAAFVGCTYHCG